MSITNFIQNRKAKKQVKKYNKKFNVAHFFISEYYLFYRTENDTDQIKLEEEMKETYEKLVSSGQFKYSKTEKFLSLLENKTNKENIEKESNLFLIQDNHVDEFMRYFNWLFSKIHVYYKFNRIYGHLDTLSVTKYGLNKQAINEHDSFYPLVINKYLGESFLDSVEKIEMETGIITELDNISRLNNLDYYVSKLHDLQEEQINQFFNSLDKSQTNENIYIPYHLNQFLNIEKTKQLIDKELDLISNKYLKNTDTDAIRKLYLNEHYKLCYFLETINHIKNTSEDDYIYSEKTLLKGILRDIMSCDLVLDYLIKIRIQLFKILSNIEYYKNSLIILDKYLITFESIYLICRELSFYNFKYDLMKENFYFEMFETIKNIHEDLIKSIKLDEQMSITLGIEKDLEISSEDKLKIAKEYFQLQKSIIENK